MTDVAIRKRVVETEVVDIKGAIGKRIAFVRIVVLVFRERVVPLELIAAAETLTHAYRKTVVHRLTDSAASPSSHRGTARKKLLRLMFRKRVR